MSPPTLDSETSPGPAAARSPREPGKNTSRRPHRKSRLGCNNCKKRRVKCDELQPTCSYCRTRSLPCQYPPKPKSPAEDAHAQLSSGGNSRAGSVAGTPGTTAAPEAYAAYPPAVSSQALGAPHVANPTAPAYGYGGVLSSSSMPNVDDLELLFNFTNSTVNCISPYNFVVTFWREELPKLAFDWPFLLHGMFALSSMQLARFRRESSRRSSEFYASQATYHWHQGLRMAGALLPQINEENCHALYVFAILSCFFSLASGPRPGNFLMFGTGSNGTGGTADGTPDWCLLLRGVGPISEAFWVNIQRGPVSPLTTNVMGNLERFALVNLQEAEAEPFRNLRTYITDTEAEQPELPVYIGALNTVSQCFSVIYDEQGVPIKDVGELVMYSMFSLTEATPYIRLLQSRAPSALIIFAHFVALFKEINFGWISHGWAPHLMEGVYAALTSKHRIHISWPMKSLSWIPPE
ncbi:hypothetical protein RB594_007014 [Gaeumannomyces avenae]